MSVEIDGVKGYEYQYLCTVLMTLQFIRFENVEVYVEDTEDAKIIFTSGDDTVELYLQVKQHDKKISIDNLCEWLLHFGNRQFDNFLLNRISQPNRYVLFISEGRCEDSIVNFVCKEKFETIEEKIVSTKLACQIIDLCKDKYSGKTILEEKRKNTVDKFFGKKDISEISSCLSKITIVEQLSFKELVIEITELLNKQFMIRIPQVDYVMKLLDESVRNARSNGFDIIPAFRETLKRFSQSILPESEKYIEYPNQSIIESELKKEDVLLLTGVPRSGKTFLAKSIAQKYAQSGYEVRITEDMDGENGAYSFLNSNVDDKRLLILEDPFGSVEINRESITKLSKLVLEKNAFERKIIVTTRMDILLEKCNKKTLDGCEIGNNQWIDMSINNIEIAKYFWIKLYGDSDSSLFLFEEIRKEIESDERGCYLEIGEMSTLKRNYENIDCLEQLSLQNILKQARVSSSEVIERIRMGGQVAEHVFLTLSMCCTTIRAVSLDDLTYIFSDCTDTPALIEKAADSVRSVSVSWGGCFENVQEQKFPIYNKRNRLERTILQCLQHFEKQGIIYRNAIANEIYFAHPIFSFASNQFLIEELEGQWVNEEIFALSNKILGVLNKNVGMCLLDSLESCIQYQSIYTAEIENIIIKALDSIFPAVKDKAIVLLEMRFDELSREQQDTLVKAVKDSTIENEHLLWHNDEPFINPQEDIKADMSDIFGKKSPCTLVETEGITSADMVSSKCIYDILNSTIRDDLSYKFLNVALECDESVIREKAIFLIFKNCNSNIDIEHFLLPFTNSNVVFALSKGTFIAWHSISRGNREKVIDYFCKQIRRVSVSLQSQRLLETFGDDYHTNSLNWDSYDSQDKESLWLAWCRIYTEYLLYFPPQYIHMDAAHMEHTIDCAGLWIHDSEVLMDLFEAWNTWLDKIPCPDEFAMCIMEKMILYVSKASPRRKALFEKMLTEKKSSIITTHIRYVVDNWSCISECEKEIYYSVVSGNRVDLKWLKAVSITRNNVPDEIQLFLLKEMLLTDKPKYIVKQLRRFGLLEPCLNVYCGYPQPLWWNGYHHSGKKVWDSIITEVLSESIFDKAFEISLREFIDACYNKNIRFQNNKTWKSLLFDEKKRKKTILALLHVTITDCQTNKSIWTELLECCEEEELNAAGKIIAESIEAVEYQQDGVGGIFELFDEEFIFKRIYPQIEPDKKIIKICMAYPDIYSLFVEDDKVDDIRDFLVQFIRCAYSDNPPRMKLTGLIAYKSMRDIEGDTVLVRNLINKRKSELSNIARKKIELADDEYALSDWV